MPSLRLLVASLIGIAAFSLSACDDPTSVGTDIIGDRGGVPQVHDLSPISIESSTLPPITGNNERTLLGYLDDPVLGTIRAHAYVDFSAPTGAGDFRDGTVSWAEIQLTREYVIGDTVGNIHINLYDMPEDWNPQGGTADTSFTHSTQVTSYTFSAADTLIALELPHDWIARNDTTLRSTSFANVFHGFYFEASAGDAVLGFSASGTTLRAASGADTVTFAMARNLTAIDHQDPADLPPGRVIVQGTGGRALDTEFNMDPLRDNYALNRAVLTVREDSLTSKSLLPHGYIRPRASQLNLFARLGNGTVAQVDAAFRNEDGEFAFQSSDLRSLVDQYLRGEADVEAFLLRIPSTVNSLDHLLIQSETTNVPRLTLTLTPLLD